MSSTDDYDPEADLAYIERLLGPFAYSQREAIRGWLRIDREGVRELAERCATDVDLDSPLAVFYTRGKAGQYLRSDAGERGLRVTPAEAFRKLFVEMLEHLRELELDEELAVEHALDYAVGSLGQHSPVADGKRLKIGPYVKGQTPLTLEDDLRASIGRPRPATAGAERERMGREWLVIHAAKRRSERISLLFWELMAKCAIPNEPSHAEARAARALLIAEIAKHGEPTRPAPPAPESVEGFTTVGDVIRETVLDPNATRSEGTPE